MSFVVNAKRKKKMPTPPWHGHLLRGVTEVSRKPVAANRGGYLLSLHFTL